MVLSFCLFFVMQVQLICSAEIEPDFLFATGNLSEWDKQHKKVLMADLNINVVCPLKILFFI